MTAIDFGVIAIILIFLVRGIWIGFIRQLASLAALILGYLFAGRYYEQISPRLSSVISSPQLSFLVTYALLFLAVFVGVLALGYVLKKVMSLSLLGWFDRFMGGIFGLVKAGVVVTVLFMAMSGLVGQPGVEVIVADGGSQDRTVAVATTAGARVIRAPLGRGSQQNAGARAAQGQVLLFLHADTKLPEGFAAHIRETLAQPGIVAGAFRFAIGAEGWRFRVLEHCANWRAGWLGLPYGDQALFLPAARFQAMGGFREVALLEDLELVLRLRKMGHLALLASPALTSPRRWQRLGIVRTTVVNQLILLGFFCRLNPGRLTRWYGGSREGNGGCSGK